MATVARQPFAPLDSARLQSLTSSKNRQNAIPSSSPGKRKAGLLDLDDSENVDPLFFSKRSKGVKLDGLSKDALKAIHSLSKTATAPKPAASSTATARAPPAATPKKPLAASRRSIPQPKTPSDRIGTGISGTRISASAPKPSAYSAPAGRSPPSLNRRPGPLASRRRTFGSYTRIDPPSFGPGSSASAPFSLDAALKGTIAGYAPRTTPPPKRPSLSKVAKLLQPETKSSWFFDIHEDSPEQEMTNLLQHSTCVLDISSDEETEERASRDTAEGRNKENIPPADHLSQVSTRRAGKAADIDDMMVEKQRIALGEINAAEFYPEGCDASSVILVFDDADDDAVTIVGDDPSEDQDVAAIMLANKAAPRIEVNELDVNSHESIPSEEDTTPVKVAVLQPIEGTGESFELWESDSSKDENEAPAASP
ncbi:hypothetical protein ESCO_005854 [Escovopsis weberi]|uniref:Thymidylate kinase n=1 Tax=Escovopsis weberi TaxID=150374 RepID=A0A0M8MZV4_ESCWE|nr:hypothetical protein ESCO_005854 [Escovopsis weberi]